MLVDLGVMGEDADELDGAVDPLLHQASLSRHRQTEMIGMMRHFLTQTQHQGQHLHHLICENEQVDVGVIDT